MSDPIIKPVKNKGEPTLKGSCLFFVNPGDSHFIFKEAKNLSAKRHFLFHSNLFELPSPSTTFWAGPAIGAPMAVMSAEKLIALGAKRIVVFGWCGSLSEDLKCGDIFLPTWSLSEEGTSTHYPISSARPRTSEMLREELFKHFQDCGTETKTGPIWTTDAPYRETRQKITQYAQAGIMAVDMEISALSTLAEYRRIELAAVMVVSDELWRSGWQPGFQKKSFKKTCRQVFNTINIFLANQENP